MMIQQDTSHSCLFIKQKKHKGLTLVYNPIPDTIFTQITYTD